jgi:hypothetical protein
MEKSPETSPSTWDFLFAQDSNESRERSMAIEPFVIEPMWSRNHGVTSVVVEEDVRVAEAVIKVSMID